MLEKPCGVAAAAATWSIFDLLDVAPEANPRTCCHSMAVKSRHITPINNENTTGTFNCEGFQDQGAALFTFKLEWGSHFLAQKSLVSCWNAQSYTGRPRTPDPTPLVSRPSRNAHTVRARKNRAGSPAPSLCSTIYGLQSPTPHGRFFSEECPKTNVCFLRRCLLCFLVSPGCGRTSKRLPSARGASFIGYHTHKVNVFKFANPNFA